MKTEKENCERARKVVAEEQIRFLKKLELRTAPHKDVEPEKSGKYLYFSVTDPYFTLQRQEILKNGELGPLQTVFSSIDLPEVKNNSDAASAIGTPIVRLSDDHQQALFIADIHRNERPLLGIKSLSTHKVTETIANVCAAEWSKDGKSIYYTQPDLLNRPNTVKIHRLGTSPDTDSVLLTENDESFYVDLSQTKDKQYTIVNSNSKTTTGLSVIDRNTGKMREIVGKRRGERYFLEHNRVRGR